MMDEHFTIQRLLLLRKVTRAVCDLLRAQLKEYLSTLGPLLRPRVVLGEIIAGGSKETVAGAEKAFKDLQAAYEAVASTKLYHLPKELTPPVEVLSSALEFTPVDYGHTARTERETKAVAVTSPLKWILSYSGFGPGRLRELLAARTRPGNELHEHVLHTLLLQGVLARQAGVVKIFEGLQFPISTGKRPEFGELPLTYVASPVSTIRPPDAVIIESTELSGMDVFEEVVNLDDILRPTDRLREQLVEMVHKHGEGLLPPPVAEPPPLMPP
ncbi:MAG: hypothetical protein L0Z62_49765 [Gemmataceae bacterium]|nr:hypothetical protein [Gemmataceae bacterium]